MRRTELPEIQWASIPLADGEAERRHERALDAVAARTDDPVSLLLSVPFCPSHCLCCLRPIQAAQPRRVVDAYVATLVDEVAQLGRRIGGGRDVLQLHLGGGSVSEPSDLALIDLLDAVRRHFRVPADSDLSVDCDPRRATEGQLRLLSSLGFGRVQFGVFDLDHGVQSAEGRYNSEALIDDVCTMARAAGFRTVTLGLMVGLPMQTPASWASTLDRVLALAPDRLVVERYRHDPLRAPGQCAIDVRHLPPPAVADRLRAHAHRRFLAEGYTAIGDEYLLDGDPLYADGAPPRLGPLGPTSAPPTPLLGVGAGAASEIDGVVYAHDGSLPNWHQAIDAGRSPVVRSRPSDGRSLLHKAEIA